MISDLFQGCAIGRKGDMKNEAYAFTRILLNELMSSFHLCESAEGCVLSILCYFSYKVESLVQLMYQSSDRILNIKRRTKNKCFFF